jgi:hypothetical protein
MSVVPPANGTEPGPQENAQASPSVEDDADSPLTLTEIVSTGAEPPSHEASVSAAEMQRQAARSQVAARIAGLADKTAGLTKQATASAVAASKVGIAKAAKIGRDTVIPELGRTGAKVAERTKPERLAKDYREFLLWLHANVLDGSVERLFFVPTKGQVPLSGLTVRGSNGARGHDYKPTPSFIFRWVLSAIEEEDIGRLSFVDYGAGKGRVLLLASQYPFAAVGGIEFAEELHDNATMNIAQFPRSRMKCRNVECVLDDVVNIKPLDSEAVHYFFNPFEQEIFVEVLKGIVASYHAKPRRLYVILVDMEAGDLMHKTGVFQEVKLPPAERTQSQLLSPYTIAVYRSLA